MVFAFVPSMILVTFVAANAKVIAEFEPFFFHLILVLVEEVISNIHFNSVVSGSYRFDIPFNVIVFLNSLNVVEAVDHKECNKNGQTCHG